MSAVTQALGLSMKDYFHQRLQSACAVLGLAAVLAPLLVLLGVHHGIISTMTERLLSDPRTLEVTPVGSGKYGKDWFRELAALPQVAYVIPQTRSIAATMNLRPEGQGGGEGFATPMLAGSEGDPLLLRWNQLYPRWNAPRGEEWYVAGVVLAESSARKLNAKAGERLEARVDRVRQGRREAASLAVEVLSILPPEAQATDMMYVPLELLVATEDYRDGKAVPFLSWAGAAPEVVLSSPQEATMLDDTRTYASFRLYARALDDVTALWEFFRSRGVEVYVKSAEIETVKSLDRSFSIVFSLIAGAAVFGFTASTASSALAGVRQKSRSLGIMRLMGYSRLGILLFPMAQTVVTGILGSFLAYALYLGVAYSIDALFAASLPGGEAVCSLPPLRAAAVFGVVILLSALSSLSAAWQATTIEPSEVIRDV